MPDFDFDAFNHDTPYEGEDGQQQTQYKAETVSEPVTMSDSVPETEEPIPEPPVDNSHSQEEVDKW